MNTRIEVRLYEEDTNIESCGWEVVERSINTGKVLRLYKRFAWNEHDLAVAFIRGVEQARAESTN